jgi:polysulfide reductase chain C
MSEFVIDFRLNREFNVLVATSFVIEGIGAATFLWGLLLSQLPGMAVGFAFILLGSLALMLDLGRPMRAWRILWRTRSSWISRGSIFIGGAGFFAFLTIVFPLLFPDYKGTVSVAIIQSCAVLFSLLTILYSGFLVSSMTPIPFWNTPILPVLFLFHAAVSGLSFVLFLLILSGGGLDLTMRMLEVEGGLLLATLIFSIAYIMVMSGSTNAARESVRLLSREHRLLFWGNAVFLGLLLPLIINGFLYFSPGGEMIALTALFLMALLRLIGDFAFRYAILKVGVFEPLM